MNDFSNLPIVIISMSRWDGDYSSTSWSLAKTFSKNQPVIYVDYAYTWTEYLRKRKEPKIKKRKNALLLKKEALIQLKAYNESLYALTPPMMFPINWLPTGKIYSFFSSLSDRILYKSIRQALKQIGHREFILINAFNPLYLNTPPKNRFIKAFVYHSQDNIRALEMYLRRHGANAEINAIKNADLSIATSKQLQKDLKELSGKQVEYLPNAADFDIFKKSYLEKYEVPEDLSKIAHPIIGYTGNICHRIDYEKIKAICESHPKKNFVMVGPRNHKGHTNLDLDAIPNLYFLGPKKLEQLPAYLAHFDILILPFLCNEVTKSIYPLKINEYLASGRPVVATPFSEDINSFKGLISLKENHHDFAEAIDNELMEDTIEKRKRRHAEASKNTWDERVKTFWSLLNYVKPYQD